MKKKNRKRMIKIVVSVLILIMILLLIVLMYCNHINTSTKTVEEKELMVLEQEEKEKEFQTDGYTLEDANVILNPYGNSPLTALILFETEEEVSPTVTIVGEDELTTFTHTFEEDTKHYLPIYGLYPDKENEV